MSAPFRPPSIGEALAGGPTLPDIGAIPLGGLNPGLRADKAGFFQSMFSAATKEQIGMLPDPSVQRFRTEHPIAGFTSQAIPEIALFSLPNLKAGAIAVRSLRPARALVEYGLKYEAKKPFVARAAKEIGMMLPILGARQAASVFAPEEGSFGRILERNALDTVFGGAFAGTAGFLHSLRYTPTPELRAGLNEPEHSLALIQQHFKDKIDLNNPVQDQLASLLRLADENPGHPILPEIKRASDLMRAEVYKQVPNGNRPYVNKLGHRKSNSAINKLFRSAIPVLDADSKINWKNFLPKDFEAFTKYPRVLEVSGQAPKAQTWNALMENLERVDSHTFLAQEGSEGLFVVAKKIQSEMDPGMNRLFVGRPDIPDRYVLLKTSKPWEFVDGSTTTIRQLEEHFGFDSRYTKVSDSGFLESRLAPLRGRKIEVAPGVEASVLPGNTPTMDAIRRDVELAKPWQKGLYGVVEMGDRLETPKFIEWALDKVSKTLPVTIPFSEFIPKGVKEFSFEAGHLIRSSARALRKPLAPAAAGYWHPRAAVLNRLTSQAFHRMLGRTRQILWGEIPDEALKGNLAKNLFLRRHDPRVGGILTKAVYALDTPEKLAEFTVPWRLGWSPEEAAQNGISGEIVDFLKALRAHDDGQITELLASRAAQGIEDSFVPLANHYSMSRMWEGRFRVELYDDTTGDLVGYAGGHNSKQAMDNAKKIVKLVNEDTGTLGLTGKLREPLREHVSTTEYLRLSKELATDARALAKEVDAFQRGAKISANNILTQRVVKASQRLMMDDPIRFEQRAGRFGWTGQFQPLELDEVLESITANTIETQRLITKESLVTQLAPEMSKLRNEYPDLYRQWVIRFNSHLGYQGPVAKAIDQLIDVPLGRFLGPNGGSRAIRQLNRAMFSLTLSAGDMGFLAVNAMSGIQTIMPEASLLLSAVPNRVNQYYDLMMLQTARGPMPANSLSPAKLLWQGFRELTKASKESDPALASSIIRAREEGIISKPIISEIREFGEVAAEHLKAKNPIEAVMRFNEDLIGRTEEFSRAWAFVVGRKIGKDFFNMNEDQAFELARRFVSRTMYEYSAGDRARITTGAVGAGWGLFKNWTMHYVANLAAYSNEALYKNNWGPLLWAMAGTAGVGGAVAMPGYGAANSMAKLLSDKDLTDWSYEVAGIAGEPGRMAADGFNYGFPSVFGYTLQGRASAPSSQVIRDTTMFLNMGMADRAVGLYRFMGNTIDQLADGNVRVFNDKRVQRTFMQAFSPRTLQRAYTYWGHEGLDSLRTGNRLVNKVSKTDAFLHSIGFTPIEVERSFDASADLYNDTNALRKRIQFYGEGMADAQQSADFEEMKRIQRRVWAEGLPTASVYRSAQSRLQKDHDELLERQFDNMIVQRKKYLRGF